MRGLGLAVALAGLAFFGAGCAGAHHANASMRPGGILASGNCWNLRTHGGAVTRTRFKCADYHPVVYQCVSGCTVSFHSSRHHYTVEQVREAFAAQGIFLVPNPQLAGPALCCSTAATKHRIWSWRWSTCLVALAPAVTTSALATTCVATGTSWYMSIRPTPDPPPPHSPSFTEQQALGGHSGTLAQVSAIADPAG